MRVSMSVTNFSWSEEREERAEPNERNELAEPTEHRDLADQLAEIVEAADRGGLYGVWVADHLLQADPYGARPGETEMLEAYTTLGYVAARTSRVRLGTMVSAVTFRPPALLVKAVTTLDVLSRGRAMLGIGAGYHGDEAAAMGLPLPPLRERFDSLEEALQIALRMWAGDASAFHGRYYTLEAPVGSPLPVSRPHPPILVGGTGEKRTLPLVARYADACNVFDIPDGGATVRHKLGVLRACCEEAGRPYDEVEKVISTRLQPDEQASSFVERCAAFADLGIEHACVVTTGPWTPDAVVTLSEAARDVADLAPHAA